MRSTPPPSTARTTFGTTESRIFDLINSERTRRGLPALVFNPELDRMAKIQAQNMAHFQKMAHVLPDAQLPTLGDRARYVGYPFGRLAENVALGYPNAETVVDGWMASSGHRGNILDRDVAETGIGIARSSTGGVYYCQVFGRQLRSL
ncbi:MAG: CAP domain-containing protein [Gemmatimonadota bacterium]|nr:CAP domain-containing protein [Gemmatimonadota bacterium]